MEKLMIKSGFVNILKPTGMTSSDVVCKVKKILGIKKVGHLGTLDPAASGVLPIALGKATKFFDYFLKKDKIYVADVVFGTLTDTLDSFGVVIQKDDVNITLSDIEKVLGEFVGKIQQIPPKYSAIKINGKKACDLARMGQDIEIAPREIEIYSIELLGELKKNYFRFKVHCSSGTYIRTLFNDIAIKLNTVATTPVIIRTKSGVFEIDQSVTLDQLQGDKNPVSIECVFKNVTQINIEDENLIKKLANGVKLTKSEFNCGVSGNFLISYEGRLIGMYHYEQNKIINQNHSFRDFGRDLLFALFLRQLTCDQSRKSRFLVQSGIGHFFLCVSFSDQILRRPLQNEKQHAEKKRRRNDPF